MGRVKVHLEEGSRLSREAEAFAASTSADAAVPLSRSGRPAPGGVIPIAR
jgi:hypothetical protein